MGHGTRGRRLAGTRGRWMPVTQGLFKSTTWVVGVFWFQEFVLRFWVGFGSRGHRGWQVTHFFQCPSKYMN